MIDVACDGCGRAIQARDEHAGKRVKCPGCGLPVPIPVRVDNPFDPTWVPLAAPAPPPATPTTSPPPAPATTPYDPAKFGEYERLTLMRLDRIVVLLENLTWHVGGLWWFFWGPVVLFLCLVVVLIAYKGIGAF